MKHIKPMNENFEDKILKKSEKIEKLKETLRDTFIEGRMHDDTKLKFSDYWDTHGDKIIHELGLVDKEEQHGNIREILPTMRNLGYQWSDAAARVIIEKLNVAELRDFKNWLKSVEGTIRQVKNTKW